MSTDSWSAKAKDPNTPVDELRALATQRPDEVLANPVLPLLDLDRPGIGAEIRRVALVSQALKTQHDLTQKADQRLLIFWACDVVEQLIPAQTDPRLRGHLAICRAYARGDSDRAAVNESVSALPRAVLGASAINFTIKAVQHVASYPLQAVEYTRLASATSGDKRTPREIVLAATSRLRALIASGLPDPRQLSLLGGAS